MTLRHARPALGRATMALALGALLGLAPVAHAQSQTASDRARLAGGAPSLFESEGDVSASDLAEAGLKGGAADGARTQGRDKPSKLDRDQAKELRKALKNGHAKRGRLVRFPKKLATAEAFAFGYAPELGVVAEERPAGGGRLLAVRDELVDIDGEAYGWVGRLYVADDPTTALGTISLVYRDGVGVSGSVQVRTDLYTIVPLGKRLHALVDVDEAEIPDGGSDATMSGGRRLAARAPGAPSEVSPEPVAPSLDDAFAAASETAGGRASTTARVLVLYTQGAASGVANISSLIDEAIMNSNTAYSRSRTAPRLQLAHKQLLSGFNESGIITTDTDRDLPNNPTARSLRDTYKADLVVLLTRPGAYSGVAGKANVIYTPGQTTPEGAYAIVDVAYAVTDKVFTHEVGHLQGAQHHPEDPIDPAKGYSYGRGHRERWSQCFYGAGWICGYNRFATIMAYTEGGVYPHVWNISNPDVEEQGRTTGQSGRDNARVLDATATTISAYRQNPLTASVSGPSLLFPLESGTWTASLDGGAGTTSYKWYKNGSYTGVTSPSYSTTAGYADFSLRVDVVRGSETASGSKYVTVYDNGGCAPDIVLCPVAQGAEAAAPVTAGLTAGAAPEAFALGAVGPNPVAGSATVSFDVPEASAVAVVVYDVLGREVARVVDGEVGAGTHRVQFDASALSPGVYVVHMRAGTFVATRRVTVAQ
ncbi:zinc-dependent metalloprotease [Rubrivirga sp. S365]|uniref:zinc-dependent metalloprotease n=1 Tax=Rubrivirga sp. S365 TaxID=3076080 RepID=UPI0028CA3CB5|nr:zinc-dependent metalloprotease [Rubrivirga sp. S365]MDT7858170.1 zinc-dependent metalloprotease [Rubrivirga sp. S365]